MFKRILMAAAGYMAYRWWNKRSEEPPARTSGARVAAADPAKTETPRRH